MMTFALSIVTVVATIIAFAGYKYWAASREIERVLKVNADLEQTNQQQAVEIAVKNTQISNHKTRIKNEENTHSIVREQLIDQLHTDGDLRN